MASESVQAAAAANRDTPETAPGPVQDCRSVIHIAVFFDGTGNNNDLDSDSSKWSNVARLFQSAQIVAANDKSRTTYPIYISGVGTPFNGKASGWLSTAGVWVEDRLPGLGAGAGGDRRMEYGRDNVNERLRDVLIANAAALGGTAARNAAENSNKTFAEVNGLLAEYRLIKVINLSLFGFSRGAALARAFSNRILANCARKGGTLLYQEHPLRINFMGLFDTVASFGVPAQNARTPFTERELIVSASVERCVHYVAAHEVRFSFPVDLIRKNGSMPMEWVEKTYPGVHSDVGGGYGPNDQGVDSNFARIPMREMMKEALSSGARMLGYEDLRKTRQTLFATRFECRPETDKAFRRYMAARLSVSGKVEEQIVQHLKLYYSAHGTMHRRGMQTAGDRSRKASAYKNIVGSKGLAHEVASYRAVLKTGQWLRLSESNIRRYAQYIQIQDWQLSAWDSTATNSVVDFISNYVHDSKVDFIGNVEPFSYFRPRGVDESCVSVWEEGGNWLQTKAKAIVHRVSATVPLGKTNAALGTDRGTDVEDTAGTGGNSISERGTRWIEPKGSGR